jgi:nitrate/nitrite-specific signal transduction histidine kinase
MSASSSVQEAFDFARRDFLQSLADPHDYDFSQYNSIEQVYDATEKIQKEQEKSGTLRNLNKIQPYLECMSQYVQTIDTFVQVKPEILAVIWVCSIANIFVGSLLMIIQRALSNFCCK